MAVPDVLTRLTAAGIRLTPLPDGRLWVEPRAALNDELRDLIRAHKAELLAALDPVPDARRQRAKLQALIDNLAEKTGHFTEADKREALEVALRDPGAWLEYLPALLERCTTQVH